MVPAFIAQCLYISKATKIIEIHINDRILTPHAKRQNSSLFSETKRVAEKERVKMLKAPERACYETNLARRALMEACVVLKAAQVEFSSIMITSSSGSRVLQNVRNLLMLFGWE